MKVKEMTEEQLREFVEDIFDKKRLKWAVEDCYAACLLVYGMDNIPNELLEIFRKAYNNPEFPKKKDAGTKT